MLFDCWRLLGGEAGAESLIGEKAVLAARRDLVCRKCLATVVCKSKHPGVADEN